MTGIGQESAGAKAEGGSRRGRVSWLAGRERLLTDVVGHLGKRLGCGIEM